MTEEQLVARFDRENPDLNHLPENFRKQIYDNVMQSVSWGMPLEKALDDTVEIMRSVLQLPRPASAAQFELDCEIQRLNVERQKAGMQ